MVDLVVVAGKGDKFSSSGGRDAKAGEEKSHYGKIKVETKLGCDVGSYRRPPRSRGVKS